MQKQAGLLHLISVGYNCFFFNFDKENILDFCLIGYKVGLDMSY